ncbi:MAG: NADH:ubiquinone reductase (Na(+)-transporting) subunit F, partial [Rhodocyclaceae bacterium]|nr:NADH:ubiquinone reductase (Na(+)-transporting) subunit F [Rhodocyclaceae bacterium]
MTEIILGVLFFTGFILALVLLILAARARLVASGNVRITVNGERVIEAPAGGKLLGALADARLFVGS